MQIDFIGHGLNKKNKLNVGDQIATSLKSNHFDNFIAFVAFTALSGVNKLLPFLKEAKNKKITFFVGDDNKGTSKQSLEMLLENNIETYIYHQNEEYVTYHPKLFLFEGKTHSRIIIGSTNLTNSGFLSNIEANIQLDYRTETDKQGEKLLNDIKTYFEDIINLTNKNLFKLDKELIEKYDTMGLLYSQLKFGSEVQSNDGENPNEKFVINEFYENEFGNGVEPNNLLSNKKVSLSQNDFDIFPIFLERYKSYKLNVKSTGAVNKNTEEKDLYNWYRRMKDLIREDILPYELASQLKDAGFPFGNAQEAQIRFIWNSNFDKLLEFKKKEQQHLNFTYVPNTKNKLSPYYELGSWCVRQKRRRNNLDTPTWDCNYEEEKMKSINYLWEVPDNFGVISTANDEKWTDRLLELDEYYEDTENTNTIPRQKTNLGKWLNEQITLKLTGSRGKNKRFLHPIREALLGEILKKNNIEWERQKQVERESIIKLIENWKKVEIWDSKPLIEQKNKVKKQKKKSAK
ncbi:phospholipase D family protein [Flavobacterium frigoris]|uniref:PLD phosphodiesterase domain-containing protein n=1 Tax=Flavobacterium frigoris (strain PS1) TaxID=1086011 RepID=H7FTB7_FLAFP|nr:phospholipase D family protein [Flavobacterium frigoris]EIA08171.1 hypothetical protein HJ01_01893 [Flavobacterium frigoris PS1]